MDFGRGMKPSIGAGELSVFIVEPSGMQARLTQKYLSELGVVNTKLFQDGATALEAMKKSPPDLAISAMYLTDMSGSDMISTMRTDATLSGIAFILISSEDNPEYLDPIRQSGACAILTKPFELKDMRTAIFATLDFINPGSLSLDGDDTGIENLNILVVDDSHSARAHLIRVLKNIGFKNITEAENGRLGVEALDRHSYDLVITDYNMPHMDGRELVEFIRTRSWQTQVPVIMITSERDEMRLAAVRQAGVSAICDKPFEPAQIKELIEHLFASGN